MELIQTDHLTKTYPSGEEKIYAVNQMTTIFKKGSFVAVTGPSGSGKSTLLHMLGGLEKPTEGKVCYKGKDLSQYSEDELSILRRRRFGFVFQAYNLVQELTGYENILLPMMLDKKEADKSHFKNMVEVLGIGNRLNHLPSAMSGGEQQRIAIARALINKPEVVFADEPTGNLDGEAGQEVLDLLRLMNRSLGTTLLLVTHDRAIAQQAGRMITLKDGKIATDTGLEVE